MDENDITNLDNEFKRYLQILRPYLGQLLDQDVIEICNAWIKRLSNCNDDEKCYRNKYIFALCYQLAKGILEKPFLSPPSSSSLTPLPEEINSDDSSTEVECLVIDSENPMTKVIYNNPKTPLTVPDEQRLCESDIHSNTTHNIIKQSECFYEEGINENEFTPYEQSLLCYNCPEVYIERNGCDDKNDKYQYRAANLIMKLRQIKEQNVQLHNELIALKKDTKIPDDDSTSGNHKVNNATSTNMSASSSTNLNSLKGKLQELQNSRNMLIDTIANLQEKLDYYNDIKKREIEDIEAKHKLEIINLKTVIREEASSSNKILLEDLKRKYEDSIAVMTNNHAREIENITQSKDSIILEKEKIIQNKDLEISQLKNNIDEIKRNQFSVINRLLDKPDISESSSSKTEELERRLNKMERARFKSAKAYEAKLAHLQRQKHLAECSLQLQLMKQRTQVINETADENQTEITTALDKLEGKYKEIVANVQATAVQRRMQDQLALDSIIQAICGVRDTFANSQPASQLASKTMRSSNKNGNQSGDIELSTLFHGNKAGNVVVSKPYGEDSIVNEYCLDSEKLGELFDRVHIPQRDTGDAPTKK
ncbi:uncharacterized protein LOC119838775 [Zerene cesonia]|uniref:uncharacterized protein LOC119838775 n=1 Tax=Zerene cesonia TaxID=33412 RepID=UPI0018E54EE1|nr:uncharacterized protein LOC119838775 [Zerene cesonia]